MKTKILRSLAVLLFILTLNSPLSTAFGQGALTPPGAPAPMMKTLDQVEARTPIASAPYIINQSGSYYLTGNLTVTSSNVITIATNGVTLDLNGFTISSTAASASGSGIQINGGLHNLTIVNGFIQSGVTNNGSGTYSGSGFAYGIYGFNPKPTNTRVSKVVVVGCQFYGIYLGSGDSTVEACTVQTAGSDGILATTITSSLAMDCGGYAIYGGQVSDCRGQSTGSHNGLSATTALNCYGTSESGFGLVATTAQNCYGISDSGYGLSASTAENCYGISDSGYGLSASIAALNCNGASESSYGLYASTAQNCYGTSDSDYGLYASRTAIGCYGSSRVGTGLYALNANTCIGSRPAGRAIQATIANGCYALNGTNFISHKYNMP